MYLLNLELKDSYRTLKKGLKIDFLPVTVLVGDQGCGKSSLLKLLSDNSKLLKLSFSNLVHENKEGVPTFFFDSESMNPRLQDLDSFTTPSGQSKGIGLAAGLMSHFQSHGEVLREFTVNRISEAKNCVLFLDEPEAALSLKNQYRLVSKLKDCGKNNVQIILASHCLPIIKSVETVYSLEHRKWMPSRNFIRLSKKNLI